jgi:predicted Zn-dependent protease with MMP-like domain
MSDPDWAACAAPSLDDIAALAESGFAALPEGFRRRAGPVLFRIEDFADDETLDALGVEDPFELTGLYRGISLMDRSTADLTTPPSVVFLYRRPILDEWAEREDVALGVLVLHVLVHEIGHHFGLSDADIERIEAAQT